MATRMQQRRGTAAQWSNADPILAAGEIGFESDTSKFKIGDGVNHWDDLVYYSSAADLAAIIDGAPDLLNTLGELADALGDNPDIITTLQSDLGTKQEIVFGVSSTEIGYLNGVTSGIQGQIDSKADASALTAKQDKVTDVSDTEISYLNGVTSSIQTQLDGKIAAIDLSNHESDTTSIHGIADTSILVTTTGTQTLTNKTLTTPTINGPTITATGQTPTIHGIYLPATHNIIFEGETANDFETTLYVVDPTADRTISLPDATGTVQLRVTDVSDTEIGYLNGVTSAIQTQLNDLGTNKAPINAPTFTGTVTSTNNLIVDGDFTVNGTNFSASATSITIEDNLVQLAHQNAANTVDLGIVVGYNDGAAKHSGIVRDVSADKWKLFKGVTTEPSTTVDFTQGSLDSLQVGAFEATTVTPSSGVVFSDGTQTKEGVPSQTPIIQKTASYTLSALTERDDLIEMGSSSALTLTIPLNSAVAFPIGTSLDILQTSTGQVTIAGAAGVTVNATPGLKLRTQWSSATLFKRAENTWVVYGDLTA
jgi:hypothetical protein